MKRNEQSLLSVTSSYVLVGSREHGLYCSADGVQSWGGAGLLPAFRRLASLAPQAVYLAEDDLSAQLLEAGYRKVEVLHVRKRAAMSRCVHRAWC